VSCVTYVILYIVLVIRGFDLNRYSLSDDVFTILSLELHTKDVFLNIFILLNPFHESYHGIIILYHYLIFIPRLWAHFSILPNFTLVVAEIVSGNITNIY
jgi:hypothetical protein